MITEHFLPGNTLTERSRRTTAQLHRELGTGAHPPTRRHQVAALLTYLGARFDGHSLIAEVDQDRYHVAQWVAKQLPRERISVSKHLNRYRISITHPAATLEPFGYRVGPNGAFWAADQSTEATTGMWRGALHAAAILSTTGLHLACPDTQAATDLATRIEHIGIRSATLTRDGLVLTVPFHHVPHALTAAGAHNTAAAHQKWAAVRQPGQFQHANQQRSAIAAQWRVIAARRALDQVLSPEQLQAVRLRIEHPHASLAELAAKSTPPVSKDSYSGRLRRGLERVSAAPLQAAS